MDEILDLKTMHADSITIKALKAFKAVAKYKSHTRAAKELNLTQPAITKQIKLLEETLELKLFSYKKRHLSLTNAGLSLLPSIDEILIGIENFVFNTKKYKKEAIQGTIKLGIVHAAQDMVLKTLETFNNLFKEIKLEFILLDYENIIDKLLTDEIDFAFTGSITENLPVEYTKHSSHQLHMIAPKSYDHLSGKILDITDLDKEKKILSEKGSFSRFNMEKLFSKEKLENSIEINNNFTIINAVAHGFGIALTANIFMTKEIDQKIQTLNVKQLPIDSAIYLINLKNHKLSKTILKKALLQAKAKTTSNLD